MIYSATVVSQGIDDGTWIVTPSYTRDDGQPAPNIIALAADGIVPQTNDIVLCAESKNDFEHNSVRIFDDNKGSNPIIIAVFSQLFTTLCDLHIKGKATLGEGTKKMVLGEPLATWAQNVDAAIQALYTWAATGTPPPTGGIAPFSQVPAYNTWQSTNLSDKHKLD